MPQSLEPPPEAFPRLRVEGDLTSDSLDQAYRRTRRAIESDPDLSGDVLEHALETLSEDYRAFVERMELNCRADEDDAVSAALIPGLTTDFLLEKGAPRLAVRPPPAEDLAQRRSGATSTAATAPAPSIDRGNRREVLRETPAWNEGAAARALPNPTAKTLRGLSGLGDRPVSQTRAEAVLRPETMSRINAIVDSSTDPGGAMLRELRETAGVTIEEMGARTKIMHAHLKAIESDGVGGLPSPVYFRGFITAYLTYLGIHRDGLVDKIVERYRDKRLYGKPAGQRPR